MRPRDLSDYLAIRRVASNAWRTLQYCKAPPHGVAHVVRMRASSPVQLRADRADAHMFHRIFARDEYRIHSLDAPSLRTVLDLGGNVGLFALRASLFAERVISYEPFQGNFAMLRSNLGSVSNVEAVQAAAAGSSGAIRLYRPRSDEQSGVYSSHAGFGGHMSAEYDEVPAWNLSDLFKRHSIEICDLLKIDVEGQEYDILYSAPRELLRRVRHMHGEYHDVEPDDPRSRVEHFKSFLESAGFSVAIDAHRRKPNHGMFFASRP